MNLTNDNEIASGITVTRRDQGQQQQQETPATETPVEKRVPTPEEIKEQTKELFQSMGWGEPPEDKQTTSQPPAGAETPAAGGTVTPPAATPPAQGQPAAQQEPPPEEEHLSTTEIISRAAKETAREVAKVVRPPEAPQATEEPHEAELTREDQEDLRVLKYLAQSNPDFKGLDEKFRTYALERYAYEEKWLKDNPGKEFDPNDEEHKAWYDQHEPNIDIDALEAARIDMKVEQKVQEAMAPKQQAEAADRAFQRELPRIGNQVTTLQHSLVNSINPELAKLITGADGKVALTDQTIAKLEETDPIAFEVMNAVSQNELEPVILELEKTTIPELNFRLNPDANPLHRKIAAFVEAKEADMAKAPAEAQRLDGKQWVSYQEYSDRANAIRKMKVSAAEKQNLFAQLDREVWTLSVDMIEQLWADDCAKRAVKIIEKRDGAAKKKYAAGAPSGGTPKTTTTPQPQPQPQNTPAGPMPAGFKYKSPSLGGQSEAVTTAVPGTTTQKSFGQEAVDVSFSR